MKKLLYSFLFLFIIFCVYPFNISAKEKELSSSQEWVKESYQPVIEETITKLEKTWLENWTLNLAYFMDDNDKGKALESLDVLKEDIKKLRNDVKSIKLDESLHKKEMKEVKKVKKRLDKVLKAHLNQSYKVSKHIRKDKNVSSTKKYDKKINKSQKQIDKANKHHANLIESVDVNVDSFELNKTKLIDDKSSKEIVKKEKEKIAKMKEKEKEKIAKMKEKEKAKKEKEEQAQRLEEEKREKEKIEGLKKIDKEIERLIIASEGLITDIKPIIENDWSSVYVHLSNEWYLLNENEKEYWIYEIGPAVEGTLLHIGITESSYIDFVDAEGNVVATEKLLGGYKIK